MTCNVDGVTIVDDLVPTYSSSAPAGNSKIYFEVCDPAVYGSDCNKFQIADRDAMDNDGGKILVPPSLLDENGYILFNIYLRVLGKPNQCMNIDAYAYDANNPGGSLYFWAGSAYLTRKGGGKSVFVKANDLFDVWWCDATSPSTCNSTKTEISVFNDVFESYFWNILNDGTRLVQVRIYW